MSPKTYPKARLHAVVKERRRIRCRRNSVGSNVLEAKQNSLQGHFMRLPLDELRLNHGNSFMTYVKWLLNGFSASKKRSQNSIKPRLGKLGITKISLKSPFVHVCSEPVVKSVFLSFYVPSNLFQGLSWSIFSLSIGN